MSKSEESAQKPDVFLNWIIGISDGLILPFALVTGLSNVFNDNILVVKLSLLFIVFSGIILALSNYFSRIRTVQNEVTNKTFVNIGLSKEIEQQLLQEQIEDQNKWITELQENEVINFNSKEAGKTAIHIGLSYIAGGLIILSPFFFLKNSGEAFKTSCIITIISLFIFGFLKAKYTGQNIWIGAFRSVVTGCVIALCGYIVARVFSGSF